MILGAFALAYLFATFALSAAWVRLFPHTRLARRLRLDLGYFPLLPALLALMLARLAGAGAVRLAGGAEGVFVRLSGRRQYRRHDTYYSYDSVRSPKRPAARR
ncbi:MAG: hypothetical protein J2O44_06890 [Porphyrobacter sp.]|nr:hypothetical protein [Porphyrobacter sp.]